MMLDEKLSTHFTVREFLRSETAARRGIDNTPPQEVLHALERTAVNLEAVRRLLGVPIHISSGYRCLALNRAIRSNDTSAHVRGLAVDFDAPEYGPPLDICRAIYASDIQYDQLIYEHTWVHIAWAAAGTGVRRQTLTLIRGGSYAHGLVAEAT
jgi:hypothetical protein